jgi:hypothetical protein
MMKRIISFILVALCALSMVVFSVFATPIEASAPTINEVETTVTPTISEDYIPSENPQTHVIINPKKVELKKHLIICEYEKPTTKTQAQNNQDAVKEYIHMIYDMLPEQYESAYVEFYLMARPSLDSAETVKSQYKADIETFEKQEREAKKKAEQQANKKPSKKPTGNYPVATQVWNYMKNEFGWSDTVCAGIMGNLMAECGGCWTADLDWDTHGKDGLGMIQWIGERRKAIVKKYGKIPTIEEQLQFMYDELHGTNGVTRQVTDKQYKKIMNAKTPEECAFAFASYYERCAEKHRAPRKGYARTAYEYFVK